MPDAVIIINKFYIKKIKNTKKIICETNQLTGFYMMVALAFNELKTQ